MSVLSRLSARHLASDGDYTPNQAARASRFLRFAAGASLLCGVLLVCAAGQLLAADPAEAALSDDIQRTVHGAFEHCLNSVVRIEATDDQGRLAGTGFFVDPEGLLYTSYTVGGDSSEIVVTVGGLKYPAKRIVADARSGVALLKIDAKTAFLTIGDSRALQIGSPVMVMGYPLDLALTPSFGLVGGFDAGYQNRFFAMTHIRATAPVQRGQGGSPVLNWKSEVIGILISSMQQGSSCFALPIEAAEKVRRDYARYQEVRPGWIGIHIAESASPSGGSSAEVREVFANTPAQKAGIESGDILLQVGDRKIGKPGDVVDASFYLTANEAVNIRALRSGKTIEATVIPRPLPTNGLSHSILPDAANPGVTQNPDLFPFGR